MLHAQKVVLHRLFRKAPQTIVGGAGIECIGRMGQYLRYVIFGGKGQKGGYIIGVELFCCPSPGIPCEKLKGVGTDIGGRFPHGQKSL